MSLPQKDFDSIYSAHSRMVYWTAYGIVREHNTANDVMQNVFLRVFHHLAKLSGMPPDQCRAWLYRVTYNASLDMLRRTKRQIPTEDVGTELTVSEIELPENILVDHEARDKVRNYVNELPQLYREPIVLYYFSELSYQEIVKLLNVNEGTLKSRMARGRKMLAAMLRKEEQQLG